ncbi:MAG: ABC transporter permease subunit [Eubacteriales bacterium]|nr:ABC transporter permease subunit [Eubacteriales bacterium]MDY5016390.1 ABC transporter permease subunit [Eubacteriales bacterium]
MDEPKKTGKRMRPKWLDDVPLYIMALPGLLSTLIWGYLPLIGLVMAFQKLDLRKGIFSSPWVGFENFKFLFTTTDAWVITRNTVCYNVVWLILGTFLSVLMALLLSELVSRKLAKTLQTFYMMPYFLSWPVVAIIALAFLSPNYGVLNKIVAFFGGPERTNWYQKVSAWPFILTFFHLWKGCGYSAVVYLATISGISQEYYEAAMLDGATKFQQARYITIPHMKTIISIQLIMAIGGIFRGDFGLFYTVTQNTGILYPVTNIIDTYVYNAMSKLNNYGMATAAGLYQSVVGCILLLIANKVVERIEPENALF